MRAIARPFLALGAGIAALSGSCCNATRACGCADDLTWTAYGPVPMSVQVQEVQPMDGGCELIPVLRH